VTHVRCVLNREIFDSALPACRMQGIKFVLLSNKTVRFEIHYVIKLSKIDRIWDVFVIGRYGDVGDVPELIDLGQKTTIKWHKPDRISVHYYICRIFL